MKTAHAAISNQGKKPTRRSLFDNVVSDSCHDLHKAVLNYQTRIQMTVSEIRLGQGKLQ